MIEPKIFFNKSKKDIGNSYNSTEDYYTFGIVSPEVIPEVLTELTFKPQLKNNGVVVDNVNIGVSYKLIGTAYADKVPIDNFVTMQINSDGTFTLTRVKKDLTMELVVTCEATVPNGSVYQIDFSMRLFD